VTCPMLDVKDIHTYYGKSYVLQGVTLGVTADEIVALLGRNGAGKTTTLRSIMGLTPPARGKILLEGCPIHRRKTHQISNLGIGYVPGDRQIFTECSVYENLLIRRRDSSLWNYDEVYQVFPILKVRARHMGRHLSGGEQQMLAIGRALMGGPKLLLMDEPSQGLAPLVVRTISDVMKELKGRGVTILLVEQNVEMAVRIADHYYIMDQGSVVYSGDRAQFIENTQVREKYLGV